MKGCPQCARLYPNDAGFCPIDGQRLVSATQAPAVTLDNDKRVGQIFCKRYEMRRVVADGGMGRVYEALDLITRRNVAVKLLHSHVAEDEVALERFKREFDVSKRLPHEHIVEVLDFQATHDGTYALVMEFLYGEELRATLKRETVMAPARLVRIMSQLALGLDRAHRAGFVHRDLKPENCFLCQTRDGDTVKILDFGSVKEKAGDTDRKLTAVGTTIGSPYYMAPEQAQGLETLDQRADVWALAAIAYECLTGKVPFNGKNEPSILLEILTKEPPLASVAAAGTRSQVPKAVDRLMIHAFKKNPSLRIASVGDLADGLGKAYGLTGSNAVWATRAEAELVKEIGEKLPEILKIVPKNPSSPSIADQFFGERESLVMFADKPPDGSSLPPRTSTHDQLVAAGVPKNTISTKWVVVGISLVMVLAILVLVLLFTH